MPANCVGKNDVFVGRIRKDLDDDNGFHMWVVSDNLLKVQHGTQFKLQKA